MTKTTANTAGGRTSRKKTAPGRTNAPATIKTSRKKAAARSTLGIKRVYDPPAAGDGARILVDRLWPRGLSREKAAIDDWMRDVAPSSALRRWFGHDPARWDEFQRRFARELDAEPDAVRALAARVRGRRATLLFGAHDAEHNNAVALRTYLAAHFGV